NKYSRRLSDHLESIGREVLTTSNIYSRKTSVKEDALGYGGITACFVSTFNVPTCCPPALWCPGTVEESPWIPLFIRRGYQADVTLT
ncbi:phosphoribosyltransferase-like protein, partial [Candidatus Binatus sp.]|uniref:phosphoribosyltransferase-like protein n=1 Tax=Candidatus Binatus sp. TaxID=2811406 RepID=UPI003BAE434F